MRELINQQLMMQRVTLENGTEHVVVVLTQQYSNYEIENFTINMPYEKFLEMVELVTSNDYYETGSGNDEIIDI